MNEATTILTRAGWSFVLGCLILLQPYGLPAFLGSNDFWQDFSGIRKRVFQQNLLEGVIR